MRFAPLYMEELTWNWGISGSSWSAYCIRCYW